MSSDEGFKHSGSIEDLLTILRGCGYEIKKVEEKEKCHQIRTTDGAVVNWFLSTGTVQFQGKTAVVKKMKQAWIDYGAGSNGGNSTTNSVSPLPSSLSESAVDDAGNKRVFVVHGHDVTSKEQLELILHKLELDPYVLANTGGDGLTIIEALEKEIGPREGQCKFGIVLLTPDDFGYLVEDGPEKGEPRARQNVVLDMGMLISALGRKNVAILKKGHLDVPSDAQGIIYLGYNEHVKQIVPKLADRLRSAGFVLNPAAITSASS